MLEVTDSAWPALLQRACTEGFVRPVFQPIVDVSRGVVCGYEGLARIDYPNAGGPQKWFAAAALHGYSGRLEAASVMAMLSERKRLPRNCFLSVNFSPDGVMADEVIAMLKRAGDLSGLVLEITEQTPVEDYDALRNVLNALRARGAMVAVDDTGAGYASLRHLIALRPQFVKLDRGLVSGLDRDPHRAAAVAAIGAFAGELDAWLVAEGVEHETELERLADLGVPLVQGDLLGRPGRSMAQLPAGIAGRLRARHATNVADEVHALSRPAPVVRQEPDFIAEMTILVDERGWPKRVLVPAGGRRADSHPAMCVQAHEDVRSVALRATGRPSEDRYGPICLCDVEGKPIGLIAVHALLESLARTS